MSSRRLKLINIQQTHKKFVRGFFCDVCDYLLNYLENEYTNIKDILVGTPKTILILKPCNIMEKFAENLKDAEKFFKNADHMIYVTFPLVKDRRILLKTIEMIKNSVTSCIKAILQYEYLFKRISLYKDPKENFRIFVQKSAPKYGINDEEVKKILDLFDYVEKHQKSPFEFVREEKVVILSENMSSKTLTLEKTKEFLVLAKDVLMKTKEKIEND